MQSQKGDRKTVLNRENKVIYEVFLGGYGLLEKICF
jgi:hypothetical protein